MAGIDLSSVSAPLNTGVLQLQNGVAMDSTLRNVADQSNTTSPLKLSTTAVQVVSPLRITTDDPSDMYLDCEDGATNNRFNITRNTASQQVNLNFASNPAGSTTIVGAVRTYVDGTNLSEVMTFREDGNVGIGTTNPTARLRVISADTNGIAEFFQNGNTSSPLHLTRYGGNVPINLNTSGGTSTSPVPVGDNIQMSRITTNTYNGTAFANSARIEVLTKGIQSATNYGSVMRFLTTPENATSMNEVMSLTSDGNVQIGIGYFVAGGARLGIKGSGSTSATTSLLVQNSSGNNQYRITDDGTHYFSHNGNIRLTIDNVGSTFGQEVLFTNKILFQTANRFEIDYDSVNNIGTFKTNNGGMTNAMTITSLGSVRVGIGQGIVSADSSSVLELKSTTLGFLPPRMTNAQRAAITTPAIGLMVYCTDAVEGLYIYKSTGWTFVI